MVAKLLVTILAIFLSSNLAFGQTTAARMFDAAGNPIGSVGDALKVSGSFSGGGDGATVDGANPLIKATVFDYTNANPLATQLVDSNGDPVSVGGGTQYAQGTAATDTDQMMMAGCVRADAAAVATGVVNGDRARCIVDATGRLWTHVGTIDGGTITTITNPVAVTQSGSWTGVGVTGTFWQATQPVSGTVTVTDGAGALNVICDSGCGGAASFEDDDPFTATTTPVNIMGALYDTTPPTITDGNAGAVRMNVNRQLLVDGSAVTQPVSGTFWQATQPVSGTFWQATQPISAASLPLPTGAATEASLLLALTSANFAAAFGTAGTADTQVMSVQGIAGMTKLLVTPDSVALPANQSVNISQINAVTPLMGAGNTGTGSQRVTLATDNAALPTWGHGATGAAPPANAVQMGGRTSGATGGFLTGIPVCDSFANVNVVTATTTLLVTGVSGRHVRICSMALQTAGANNVALISGTGATCGTGTTGMTGGTTAATGFNFVANQGIAQGNGIGTINQTGATGDSVCVITSAAVQLSGRIAYTIY